jgi:AbrB family looped-hinge helix DNA binding protein
MKATITSKGQITIPAKVRRKLNLKAGQVLEFDEHAPYLKATRVFDPAEMYATIGCLKDKNGPARSAEDWLNKTRGKVKLPGDRNAHGD